MSLNKIEKINTSVSIFLALLLAIKSMWLLDPDFGWHLQTGRLILHSGITYTDPFSYSMPTYPFIDHEWLINIIIALFYNYTSYISLVGLFSSVTITTMLLVRKIFPTERFWDFSQLLMFGILISFFGIRVQVFSWLFLSISLILLFSERHKNQIFLYPILMLVWTNSHGSFPIGICVLTLYIAGRTWQEKKFNINHIIILALSTMATFVNPFGGHIWFEIKQQLTDSNLKWNISEWRPVIFIDNLPMIALFSLSGLLTYKYKKIYSSSIMLIYLFLLVSAIFSARHLPLWTLLAAAMLPKALKKLQIDSKSKKRFQQAYTSLYFIILIMVLFQFGAELKNAYNFNQQVYPSSEAISYLRDNPNGNYFPNYNWGGYLIWKLPEKKVFIDGRMPSWRRSANKTPEHELSYAFKLYKELQQDSELRKHIFNKFSIGTVIWPQPQKFNKLGRLVANVTNTQIDSFGETLKNNGWKVVYMDETAIIYQRYLPNQ